MKGRYSDVRKQGASLDRQPRRAEVQDQGRSYLARLNGTKGSQGRTPRQIRKEMGRKEEGRSNNPKSSLWITRPYSLWNIPKEESWHPG